MAAIVNITALPADQVRSCGATACGAGASSLVRVAVPMEWSGSTRRDGARSFAEVLVIPSCDSHTAEVRRTLAAEFSR